MPDRLFKIKYRFLALLKATSLLSVAAFWGCSHVTCTECTSGAYPLVRNGEASFSGPDFPPLKFAYQPADSQYRHIYLEGDGKAWHRGRIPSKNPTSQQKLALRLMLQDSSDSLYLDRPCYGYKAIPASCDNSWWTNARYSEEVVAAMNEALDGLQRRLGEKPLVLIGHSGGGTLALLLAQRRSDVHGVITLAGNLAPHRWAEYHGYLPLEGSLSPNFEHPPNTMLQWHYAGEDDENIPPALAKAALNEAPQASLLIVKGDHNCCWRKHWPTILERLTESLTNDTPAADDMAHK